MSPEYPTLNQEMSIVLKPKCLLPDEDGNIQCLGHSAEGFLVPCCWMDAFPKDRGFAQDIFFQDKLKISNVDNIFEIIRSKEWLDFYELLLAEPEEAPPVCQQHCCDDENALQKDKYGWVSSNT